MSFIHTGLVGKFISLILSLSFAFGILASEDAVLKEAKQAFSRKAYSEAIKKFSKYSDLHPSEGVGNMYMGYIYEYKKDYPKSIQNFRKAAELNLDKDQRKTVLLKLALFFNYHQDWNLAATYSSRYLKYDSKNEEMQKIYNRAVGNRGNPGSNTSYVHVIKPQETKKDDKVKDDRQDKKDNSKQQSQNSLEDGSEAQKSSADLEKSVAANPNNEELRWEYSLALFDEKKYDLAEENIKILLEKDPSRTRYHYKMGIVKLRKDDPKAAIESFEKARKNPFSKETNVFFYYVYLNEGLAYQKLNQLEQAEESYKAAFKQVQKDPPLLGLARLNHQKSEWVACSEHADNAVAIAGQTESHMFRFVCLGELGKSGSKFQNSFDKYHQFLESNFPDPKKSPDKYKVGFLRLARHLTTLGKEANAEKYFASLENEADVNTTREYLFYRGKNLFYLGKSDDAIPLLQKVPSSSAAYFLLARIYAKKGDLNSTKSNLKLAGGLKDEYWSMANTEADFAEFRKDPKFVQFINRKGSDDVAPKEPPAGNSKSTPLPSVPLQSKNP
ncbi:hypothetical protein LPTSP3_g35410 [Leptospira kobayashii]|uniref:Tetratricopeptide repeat protein n=1 Tax=Leptospira kobayashii TaxID=1917830 RepID=A0ABN6KK84_9LEPT|nr:tetratricopeptide repeat protein [Leptospira kobayashii]BDA80611.1 hypothetical protein LPTSP3_g35410 [Leptospira kobayashii]